MILSEYFILPAIFLFLASPGSGKTYFIKYLITEFCRKKKFRYGLVFTNTDDYDKFLPDGYVHRIYNENILKKLIKLQRENGNAPCFVVFDDCLSFNFNTPFFNRFISEYRHYNISIFIGVQHLLALKNPLIYQCATYVFIPHNDSKREIKIIYDQFGSGLWKSQKDLAANIDIQCKNYVNLVINTRETDKKKKLMTMKAPEYKKMRIEY